MTPKKILNNQEIFSYKKASWENKKKDMNLRSVTKPQSETIDTLQKSHVAIQMSEELEAPAFNRNLGESPVANLKQE